VYPSRIDKQHTVLVISIKVGLKVTSLMQQQRRSS